MKVSVKSNNAWDEVMSAAYTTIGKKINQEPTSEWKLKMLLAEHSPIRKLIISWKWEGIQYWVSTHFVRHKVGIEHYVRSQRPDRTGSKLNRDEFPQGTLVDHECIANAQAIINISRKRLCRQAATETRLAWIEFLNELAKVEPELQLVCVPDCIYRGSCFEFRSCGWFETIEAKEMLERYRMVRDWIKAQKKND